MKSLRLLTILTGIVLFLAAAGTVSANQGRFSLRNASVDCEGISIWQDNRYDLSGICSGLVYPYQDQLDRYSFWVTPDDGSGSVWIGDIQRGVITGTTEKRFSSVFVTAEANTSPPQPSTAIIVSGALDRFNFPLPYSSQEPAEQPQQQAQETPQTPPPVATAAAQPQFNLGSAQPLSLVIVAALLFIIVGALVVFRH